MKIVVYHRLSKFPKLILIKSMYSAFPHSQTHFQKLNKTEHKSKLQQFLIESPMKFGNTSSSQG